MHEDLRWTASSGIVSGLRRTEHGATLIQTDASVNPGNSGGALLDERHQLVGVVTSKMMGVGIEGLAFAVGIPTVTEALGIAWASTTDLGPVMVGTSGGAPVQDQADASRIEALLAAAAEQEKAARAERLRLSRIDNARSTQFAGVATVATGAALVIGTWAWAMSLDTASPEGWLALESANLAGWGTVAGGGIVFVVGTAMRPRDLHRDATSTP
jgi:hypothetical protein